MVAIPVRTVSLVMYNYAARLINTYEVFLYSAYNIMT